MKNNSNLNIYKLQGKKVKLPKQIVVSLFLENARKHPDRVAVFYQGQSITYKEINEKSNTISKILIDKGVKKGDVVFNRTNNSIELLVSLLGILKSGGVYLPIDPLWPEHQTINSIEQIKPKIIVTNLETESNWGAELLYFSFEKLKPTKSVTKVNISKKDPAYGFFTSGTTGKPKACINTHEGLLNRLCYMTKRYGCSENDVILQNSNYMFDASLWQLLWPLLNGAKVVIPANYENFHPEALTRLIYSQKVTFTDFVPSIFKTFVEYIENHKSAQSKVSTIRQILIGGEAMNIKDVNIFKKIVPKASITNTYGPTECSIGTIFHEITEKNVDSVPIGKPIDNVYALILDKNKKLISKVNQVGEIYLGGICVGLGYLGNKKETKKAFIKNPFDEIMSEKLYKTGDLGCYDFEGNICYMGRSDTQVKINGVRIELSSIENKVKNLDGVTEAFVFVSDLLNHKKELYLLATTEKRTNQNRLVAQLHEILPLNLIPPHIRTLKNMPLTANGKVNRKLLVKNINKYFL